MTRLASLEDAKADDIGIRMAEVKIEYGVNPKAKFITDQIMPIHSHAAVYVYIDGIRYCGFASRTAATRAVALWRGETDGFGRVLPPGNFHGCHWPAIHGKKVTIEGGGFGND